MNIQDALQTAELYQQVQILWQEREIVTAVLYEEYCKRNNLLVPKHINELLKTAYTNYTSSLQENEEATLEQKEIQQQNIKEGKKIFSPKDF